MQTMQTISTLTDAIERMKAEGQCDPRVMKYLTLALQREVGLFCDRHNGVVRKSREVQLIDGCTPDEIEMACGQGKKIGAIKMIRTRTGLGLKMAKDMIEAAMDREFRR